MQVEICDLQTYDFTCGIHEAASYKKEKKKKDHVCMVDMNLVLAAC